jgi:hypothetical protein
MMIRQASMFVGSVGLLLVAGCSSSTSGGSLGGADADTSADTGSAEGGGGTDGGGGGTDSGGGTDGGSVGNNITGTYGSDPIKPVMAGFWIGQPGNPAESGGGPFIYLFSGAVTCSDLSQGSGWLTSIPTGTQVLEMIVGTTSTGTSVPTASHAGKNVAEVNYATGGSAAEARATSGNVTLTSYIKDVAVEGTIDVTFPTGKATGTFHATWCPGGNEL